MSGVRGLAWVCALGLLTALGCDTPVAPTGPPRCEPSEELVVERTLKEGFKALAERDVEAATEAFRAALEQAPGHPEAQLGMRLARRGDAVVRPRRASDASDGGDQGAAGVSAIVIGGERVPVDLPVNTERYRFEELRAYRAVAREHRHEPSDMPLPTYYRERRTADGQAIAADDRAGAEAVIDLVVLHDTQTTTARESMVELSHTGASTHFIIDWDGTVFQALDLALEANHVKQAPIDRRSVAIDLVNPVDPNSDRQPVPVGAPSAEQARGLSAFTFVQGEELQHWGYTEAQMNSLSALLRALVKALPRLDATFPPAGADDRIPRAFLRDPAFRGIAGHLHFFPRAYDPGAGFDWEGLRARVRP